jgi:hypothetical protein
MRLVLRIMSTEARREFALRHSSHDAAKEAILWLESEAVSWSERRRRNPGFRGFGYDLINDFAEVLEEARQG